MADTLIIEAGGEAVLALTIEQAPELVFEEQGIQGPPGLAGPPGAGIDGYDPGDLTLIFDNRLI